MNLRIDGGPANYFTEEKARRLVAQLNRESDDGWTYRAELDRPGAPHRYLVVVYDEEGVRVGSF